MLRTDERVNRMYDIMFTENYRGRLVFGISNKLVTGVQKLVQIFIGRLLNTLGTAIAAPQSGSDLLRGNIGTNNIQMIQSSANIAVANVTYTIKKEQAGNSFPVDERLDSATLTSVTKGLDWMSLFIEIRTESKEKVHFQIPIEYKV
jgi:hypothetical protein